MKYNKEKYKIHENTMQIWKNMIWRNISEISKHIHMCINVYIYLCMCILLSGQEGEGGIY